jgi:hypothetical protein
MLIIISDRVRQQQYKFNVNERSDPRYFSSRSGVGPVASSPLALLVTDVAPVVLPLWIEALGALYGQVLYDALSFESLQDGNVLLPRMSSMCPLTPVRWSLTDVWVPTGIPPKHPGTESFTNGASTNRVWRGISQDC